MGLFKSNKPPPPPIPDLFLHLSNPVDKVFKPNDTITGHISLSTPIPITPQAIEVSLWGHSSTWIRTSSSSNDSTDYKHYRDNAPLFNVTFNVFPQPHQLAPGQNYTFPFNFRVPRGTGYNRSDCYKDAGDTRWTVVPHELPPTFFSGDEPDSPDNAEISYGVTARLLCVGVGVGKYHEQPLSATSPIIFAPYNPHANFRGPLSVVRCPKQFTLQSSSLTGTEPSSIGFRQRVRDKFSSGTPKLDFEAGVEVPDLLTSGEEFKFRTTFTVVHKDHKVTHIPPIHFKILKLELLDFTFFRAPRDWSASNTMSGDPCIGKYYEPSPGSSLWKWEEDLYSEKKTLLNSIPDSRIVQLEEIPVAGEEKQMEQAKQCEFWFAARVPGFTPPSFTSFAITRAYRVKIKLGVEIGEKKFVLEAETQIRSLGSTGGFSGTPNGPVNVPLAGPSVDPLDSQVDGKADIKVDGKSEAL